MMAYGGYAPVRKQPFVAYIPLDEEDRVWELLAAKVGPAGAHERSHAGSLDSFENCFCGQADCTQK